MRPVRSWFLPVVTLILFAGTGSRLPRLSAQAILEEPASGDPVTRAHLVWHHASLRHGIVAVQVRSFNLGKTVDCTPWISGSIDRDDGRPGEG